MLEKTSAVGFAEHVGGAAKREGGAEPPEQVLAVCLPVQQSRRPADAPRHCLPRRETRDLQVTVVAAEQLVGPLTRQHYLDVVALGFPGYKIQRQRRRI